MEEKRFQWLIFCLIFLFFTIGLIYFDCVLFFFHNLSCDVSWFSRWGESVHCFMGFDRVGRLVSRMPSLKCWGEKLRLVRRHVTDASYLFSMISRYGESAKKPTISFNMLCAPSFRPLLTIDSLHFKTTIMFTFLVKHDSSSTFAFFFQIFLMVSLLNAR